MRWIVFFLSLFAVPCTAESLIATRTIRSQTILTSADISLHHATLPGALRAPEDAIGMETRTAIYAGRPIRPEDIGPPATIERNEVVPLVYSGNGLTITTEARALGRAGPGDRLRVLNIFSRATVVGTVGSDGAVHVTK